MIKDFQNFYYDLDKDMIVDKNGIELVPVDKLKNCFNCRFYEDLDTNLNYEIEIDCELGQKPHIFKPICDKWEIDNE